MPAGHRRVLLATVLAVSLLAPLTVHAGWSVWLGSSGLYPDQVSPAWTLFDIATPEDPSLAGGVLTLATDSDPEQLAYFQGGTDLNIPDPWIIEARVRYVSGTTQFNYRTATSIGFFPAVPFGNILYIGLDEIFLLSGVATRGPADTTVDTNDAFHTYRIEVTGAGAISVYQDGALKLTHTLFSDPGNTATLVGWGDTNSGSSGVSEWTMFQHNGHVGGLAVQMGDIHAARRGDAVVLEWQTLSEIKHAGFRVLREEPGGDPVDLTTRLIEPHTASGEMGGARYAFTDERAPLGSTRYWIEDVDTTGRATRHGPVTALPAWQIGPTLPLLELPAEVGASWADPLGSSTIEEVTR